MSAAATQKQDLYEVINPVYKTLEFCSFEAAASHAKEIQKLLVRQGLGNLAAEIKVQYKKTIWF